MALDTALKRQSAIHHGCPWRGLLPIPDGTVDQVDRQVLAWLYSGISATVAAITSGTRRMRRMAAITRRKRRRR